MANNNEIYNRIEETLNSLDRVKRATPTAFFYTRLRERLMVTEKSIWEMATQFIARPAVAFIAIFFILLLNTIAVLSETSFSSSNTEQADLTYTEEYKLRAGSLYEIENQSPDE